mmetsp:Transcript_37688/g.86999  ORF Transcript_37688/g.86999 Transcript_37688/m.86999 type:complete len:207 (+) Transcript_37688:108-728(+)
MPDKHRLRVKSADVHKQLEQQDIAVPTGNPVSLGPPKGECQEVDVSQHIPPVEHSRSWKAAPAAQRLDKALKMHSRSARPRRTKCEYYNLSPRSSSHSETGEGSELGLQEELPAGQGEEPQGVEESNMAGSLLATARDFFPAEVCLRVQSLEAPVAKSSTQKRSGGKHTQQHGSCYVSLLSDLFPVPPLIEPRRNCTTLPLSIFKQ